MASSDTPSLRSLFAHASALLSQFPSQLANLVPSLSGRVAYEPFSAAPSCPFDSPIPLSCHNSTPVADKDACCFVHPGGRLLLAQFWDEGVYVAGAEQDWTLHGLWPDHCDGTYSTYCNATHPFTNVTAILAHFSQDELLHHMDRYWVASSGPNSNLWVHEYTKHATCINTLAPSCYDPAAYQPGIEVVDYFARAFQLFRMLDTYYALSMAGIEPRMERPYPRREIQRALEKFSGGQVTLRCKGEERDVLHEAWYAYFLKGSLQTGVFVPAGERLGGGKDGKVDVERQGNCADEVRYLPKRCRGPECGMGEL